MRTRNRVWAAAVAFCAWGLASGSVGVGVALAQYSYLVGSGTSTGGGSVGQSYINVNEATISGAISDDGIGNHGQAGGSLSVAGGSFTIDGHACSGGRPGWGGQANGSAHAEVNLDYRVTSATLPAGTPVSVQVRWAINGNDIGVGDDMAGANTVAQSGLDARVAVYVNGSQVSNRFGHYGMSDDAYQGFGISQSGTLNPRSDHDDVVVTVQVGQMVGIIVSGSVSDASSVEQGVIDADGQMAAVWGLTPLDDGVTLVWTLDPSVPAPPAADATIDYAVHLTPPRPTDDDEILNCFMIPTQPAPAAACAGGDAAFTVGVHGGGPFYYQWRKDGVPIDGDANPSANTDTLSLAGVSGADAGTYDCVISNPCGSITSAGASLAVGLPVISTQPSPASVCGGGTAPFQVGVAGGGTGDSYQWQIETSPGSWQDLSTDITALPCGGTARVSTEDAPSVMVTVTPCPGVGQYVIRCIVSNACGSTTSNPATLTINSADFNGDGDIGTDADIEAFFACLGGTCCATCGSADFNADGDTGTDADIESFFRVLAGGAC